MYRVYQAKEARKPIELSVRIGEKSVLMELDTGASKELSNYPIQKTKVTLYSYSKTEVPLLGSLQGPVLYGHNPKCMLDLLVVKGKKSALFGRDWLTKLKIDWSDFFFFSN